MGFASRRKSAVMKDILAAMVADASAGNDRVWIAPYLNNSRRGLSYPAAILVRKITHSADGKTDTAFFETSDTLRGTVPTVIGVTSVKFDNAGQLINPSTGYFNLRKKGGFQALDARICAVSGLDRLDGSTDVRDMWYGHKIKIGSATKTAFNDAAGYVRWDPVATAGLALTSYNYQISSGDYLPTGPTPSGATAAADPGNSVAAAQIAALATTLRSLNPTATAQTVANVIRASQLGRSGYAEPDVTDGSSSLLVIPIKTKKGKVLGKVPACVDFGAAITALAAITSTAASKLKSR
jgi:hypothetical protein